MRGKNRERCDTAKEQERRSTKMKILDEKELLEYVQICLEGKIMH